MERRRRREALRRTHPDLGGDPQDFLRVVRALSGRRPAAPGAAHEVRFVRRPHGVARIPAWCRTRLRHWRHPAPSRVI
jgi:hypothetical protein